MTGGQTVMNSWCAIRGMAITICQPNEFIIPNSAVIEDVLVLTKPLGTQVGRKTGLWYKSLTNGKLFYFGPKITTFFIFKLSVQKSCQYIPISSTLSINSKRMISPLPFIIK